MDGEADLPHEEKAMCSPDNDKVFAGSTSKLYEELLVPLTFEPYAEMLASRLASRSLARVLEVAAGTGVVSRRLAAALPADVTIIASDLTCSACPRQPGIAAALPDAPLRGAEQVAPTDQRQNRRDEAVHRIQVAAARAVHVLRPVLAPVFVRPQELRPEPGCGASAIRRCARA
jgi:hypothetical protein